VTESLSLKERYERVVVVKAILSAQAAMQDLKSKPKMKFGARCLSF
jgi:hypothetical protein